MMSSTDRSDREIIRTEYLRVSRHDEERVGIQVGNPPEGETPTIEDARDVLTSFFEYYYEVPISVNTCRRRIKDAAEASELNRRIYPHALRATAASQHAYKGLNIASMKAMMGWEKLSTAEKYIRISGGRTKRALLELYE